MNKNEKILIARALVKALGLPKKTPALTGVMNNEISNSKISAQTDGNKYTT